MLHDQTGTPQSVACAYERIDSYSPQTFEPLIEVPHAAELLHLHPKTVQAMCRAGKLPAVRFGKRWLFRKSKLDVWVTEQLCSRNQSRRAEEP